jgi:predicted RNA-binding Zn-ribbon protein involved in translation (DUF1610 family)
MRVLSGTFSNWIQGRRTADHRSDGSQTALVYTFVECGLNFKEVFMSDQNEKKEDTVSKTEEVSNLVQSEVQSVLFECPKCDCRQTKVIGKKSYFGALGKLIFGPITAFLAPLIITIKVVVYLGTFRFNKLRKMVVQELWDKYVLWWKCLLIILTFGIFNITKMYQCEKCGRKWIV